MVSDPYSYVPSTDSGDREWTPGVVRVLETTDGDSTPLARGDEKKRPKIPVLTSEVPGSGLRTRVCRGPGSVFL